MVICRTPFRVSFFGGGTDYPIWFNDHDGMVVSTTINQYGYVLVNIPPPIFDTKYRLEYAQREYVDNINEINHPSIRETLRHFREEWDWSPERISINYSSDLPSMSGMGSSSSFTTGMVNAFHAIMGDNHYNRGALCDETIHVEQNKIQEAVGNQDQIVAAFGGMNAIEFTRDSTNIVPIELSAESRVILENNCFLIFTKLQRQASVIAKEQIDITHQRVDELSKISEIAKQGRIALGRNPIDIYEIGRLLDEHWNVKKHITGSISNDFIDDIYNYVLSNGAIGGKLLGAGGGGFLLVCVDPNRLEHFLDATSHMAIMNLRLSDTGSTILSNGYM
jgi:D-glycero-alpha-D-manno-heptose-7-phosphate kinase